MFKLTIIILNIIPFLLFSQNVWEMVEGSDEFNGRRLELIECLDSNNCFLLISGQSAGNKIYKSTDLGETWELISLHKFGGTEYATGAFFKNNNEFYITSNEKYLSITENGGNDYNTIELDAPLLLKIIMNEDKGIIISYPSIFTNDNWMTNYTVEFGFIIDFDFIDSNNVLIVTNTESTKVNHVFIKLFKYNFDKKESEHIFDIGGYFLPFKMERVNGNIFVAGVEMNSLKSGNANNVIYKSSNLGKTWRRVHDVYYHSYLIPYLDILTKSKVFGIFDVSFKNDSVGIAVGKLGMIMYTYDAGETWYYELDETIPTELKTAPTMRCEYIGSTPVITGFDKYIFRLKEDNLAPRPEDTITIDGYILEKGEPRENIAICLENRFAMTDSNGYFRFIKVKEGEYNLIPINNKKYNYLPYDFEPRIVTYNFKKDTTIYFELLDKRKYFNLSGRVLKDGEGLEGIAVVSQLDDLKIVSVFDTVYTNSDGIFTFENIENRDYFIRPISEEYVFKPDDQYVSLDTNINLSYPFEVNTSSIKDHPNFQLRNNVLISEEVAGMNYRIIGLNGRVVKSGILPKELNLNAEQIGTYILHITKGEQVIYSHKFQVVR